MDRYTVTDVCRPDLLFGLVGSSQPLLHKVIKVIKVEMSRQVWTPLNKIPHVSMVYYNYSIDYAWYSVHI